MSGNSLRGNSKMANSSSNKVLIQNMTTFNNHHHQHRIPPQIVQPQSVSEKTLMESVAGLINEVGLVPQPYSQTEEKENQIIWTKFEANRKSYDLTLIDSYGDASSPSSHLLLTLAYETGIQMWGISSSGEGREILSWRRPSVHLFQLLPSPSHDSLAHSRPLAALVEGPSANFLSFISLSTGESVKSSKFTHPISSLLSNATAILLSTLDRILVLEAGTLGTRATILTSSTAPIALGVSWMAYGERRVNLNYQSVGGVENSGTSSYTASVIYAAKSLTKGLKGLGESVANSITGHRVAQMSPENGQSSQAAEVLPGVVTVLNLNEMKENSSGALPHSSYIAHFIAHMSEGVVSLSFDPSGLLLLTADKGGHDFHVFRIHPHPLGSKMTAVHHLYVLHRGDTGARVQDISFAPDSRWVAVSTQRGTTHIFPITPYGGPVNVRTHSSHRVVNRLSRFQRSAGLDDRPSSGRSSPILSPLTKQYDLFHLGSPYPNPRLPPLPLPLIVQPLAQLRQNFTLTPSPKSSPPVSKTKGLLAEEKVHVVSFFESPRGWRVSSPPLVPQCEKRKKSPVDPIYVMTCHGTLIEYSLEPRPTTGISKDKISDDTPIELVVHAKAQWNFTRPTFSKELQPPLCPSSLMILTGISSPSPKNKTGGDENNEQSGEESYDEKWLAHVEISTHSGPHRRLWMGPQFSFKVFNPSTVSSGVKNGECGIVDIETIEVNVTNRPAKSNPVNMPISSSLLPVVIEVSSGSSLEQSPRLIDPYSESETCIIPSETHIKESLADAMIENCNISSRTGGCQSIGSCDDLSSSSFESTSQNSVDASNSTPSFNIDASLPFPD